MPSTEGWKNARMAAIGVAALVSLALLAAAPEARAEGTPLTGWIFKVTAQRGATSDTYQVNYLPGDAIPIDGYVEYSAGAGPDSPAYVFANNLGKLATINSFVEGDPSVAVGFSVVAGTQATDFTVTSTVFTFGSITNPDAWATASMTVTDRSGFNTATLLGLYPDATACRAIYNGYPGGSVFASMIPTGSGIVTGLGGSETVTDAFPSAPPGLIADAVTSITTEFKFRLSPGDLASGDVTFTVLPEPGSVLLLLAGGIGLIRRSRR